MADPSARAALGGTAAGQDFIGLVDSRLSHEPKLQGELISAAARLLKEATGGSGARAAGKENAPVAAAPAAVPAPSAEALVVLKDINLANPRGKFDMLFRPDALVLQNPKTTLLIPPTELTCVAILDNIPKDTKGRVQLFLAFSRDSMIMSGKQRLEAVIVQLLSTDQASVTANDGTVLEGPTAVVIAQALGLIGVTNFVSPDPDAYSSAGGDLAVAANVKASGGFLFPLRGALAFVDKPALFVPHEAVLAVEFRRLQSSTFDLVLHCRPPAGATAPGTSKAGAKPQEIELGQVERRELGRLQNYIAASKLKMYDPAAPPRLGGPSDAAAQVAAQQAAAMQDDDDDDEDEDDDEDYDPSAPDFSPTAAKRPSAASRKRARPDEGEAGPSAAGAGGDEGGSDGGSCGADEEDEDEEDEDGDEDEEDDLEDLTDEDDVPVQALKRHMRSERNAASTGGGSSGGAGGSKAAQKKQKPTFGDEDEGGWEALGDDDDDDDDEE